MSVVQIADGAFFVPSYSEQTITRAYDTGTTIQAFGPCSVLYEDEDEAEKAPELKIEIG